LNVKDSAQIFLNSIFRAKLLPQLTIYMNAMLRRRTGNKLWQTQSTKNRLSGEVETNK